VRSVESWLMLIVVAFAAFVGYAVVRAPRHAAAATSEGVAHDIAARTIVRQVAPPPAPPNVDSVVAKIASTPGTYLGDMIEEGGSQVVRWPDATLHPLRVWVQSAPSLRDWSDNDVQLARDALSEWQAPGIPLRFDFVLDSASADIRMEWTEQFAASMGRRVGTTALTYDQYGWIAAAEITAALHDSLGRSLPRLDLAGVLRHEAGHSLGLGHSRDPKTKMYPVETVADIQPLDRATLSLLYTLPPGHLK
jgi:hypothetical protein